MQYVKGQSHLKDLYGIENYKIYDETKYRCDYVVNKEVGFLAKALLLGTDGFWLGFTPLCWNRQPLEPQSHM